MCRLRILRQPMAIILLQRARGLFQKYTIAIWKPLYDHLKSFIFLKYLIFVPRIPPHLILLGMEGSLEPDKPFLWSHQSNPKTSININNIKKAEVLSHSWPSCLSYWNISIILPKLQGFQTVIKYEVTMPKPP